MVRLALIVALIAFAGCKADTGCDGPTQKEGCPNDGSIGAACKMSSDCKDMSLPACDMMIHACVQCFESEPSSCGGKTPACKNDQCAACSQHADCTASNACLSDGSCAAATDVAYVDPMTGTDGPNCFQGTPCKTVMAALATKRLYVKLHGTTDEAVTIDNQNVTLLADPAATLTRSMDGAILQITGTSKVEIDDLQISGGTSSMNNPGITIPGGNNVILSLKRAKITGTKDNGITISGSNNIMTIEATTISNNQKAGISCQDSSLSISRSTISSNQGGGISTGGMPTFDITNTFIYRNGSTSSNVGGASLTLSPGHTNRFEFNTVADNQVKSGALLSGGVQCDEPLFAAPNNLIVRNFVNNDPNQPNANTVGACTYPTSTIDKTVTALNFRSPDTNPYDYHIQSSSSAISKATTASSITVDFDNDPRPANARDQGADQYKP